MTTKTIDAEIVQPQALAVRETGGALSYALGIDELHQNLEFVRQVMSREMREGQDYGKIPGTGDKPTLLQPGAQKLLLTFNLTEQVKKEALREYPNLHREYEFIVCVKAQNGKEWDGVGTCSTLEAKYRYRKGERLCPKCGKPSIIQGKKEFGGGWICFTKKGGCGEKFAFDDTSITGQHVGRTEHDNPPDYWNTVRKMAFKRALVSAAINATNTSELWTQDLDDTAPAEAPEPSVDAPPPPPKQATPKPKAATDKPPVATAQTRAWMISKLNAGPGSPDRQVITEFFEKAAAILPGSEMLEDIPLEFVPVSKEEIAALQEAIARFDRGDYAEIPYKHKVVNETLKEPEQGELPTKPIEVPRDDEPPADDEPWRSFPMPFGKQAGTALEDLDRKYLFGLWANYAVETEYNGKPKKPETIAKDQLFREMLDAAGEHYNFEKKD